MVYSLHPALKIARERPASGVGINTTHSGKRACKAISQRILDKFFLQWTLP